MVLAKTTVPMSRALRDHRARNTYRALFLSRQLSIPSRLTTQLRTASVCCKALDAGCRGVRPLFSCSRGILPAPAECRGNKKKAAELLGIQRPTLYNKLKRYAIEL